jgi:hypothetical protein
LRFLDHGCHRNFNPSRQIQIIFAKSYCHQNVFPIFLQAFEFLQQKAKIQLEDPLLSDLHHTLVRQGDHDKSEQIIVKAIEGMLIYSKNARATAEKRKQKRAQNKCACATAEKQTGIRGGSCNPSYWEVDI